MSEELKLLPCPACGGGALVEGTLLGWLAAYCYNCKMCGPMSKTEAEAAVAWNALPRALTWTMEPPTTPGTYGTIRKDKTVDISHYFKPPSEEDRKEAAYWLGPLPSAFALICDMPKEPTHDLP